MLISNICIGFWTHAFIIHYFTDSSCDRLVTRVCAPVILHMQKMCRIVPGKESDRDKQGLVYPIAQQLKASKIAKLARKFWKKFSCRFINTIFCMGFVHEWKVWKLIKPKKSLCSDYITISCRWMHPICLFSPALHHKYEFIGSCCTWKIVAQLQSLIWPLKTGGSSS